MSGTVTLQSKNEYFLGLTQILQSAGFIEHGATTSSGMIARHLEELQQGFGSIAQLPLAQMSQQDACDEAFNHITKGFEEVFRVFQQELRDQGKGQGTASLGVSNLEDVCSTLARMGIIQLLAAYACGIQILYAVLYKSLSLSGARSISKSLNSNNALYARFSAGTILHTILSSRSSRPLIRIGHTLSEPSVIKSRTANYGKHELLLLKRLERSYDAVNQRDIWSPIEKATCNQQHVIYWYAQVCGLYGRLEKLSERSPRPGVQLRLGIAQDFLLAALRAIWVAQLDLDDIESAKTNSILFDASSVAVSKVCDLLHQSFASDWIQWHPSELVEFKRSDLEMMIPYPTRRPQQPVYDDFKKLPLRPIKSSEARSNVDVTTRTPLYELPNSTAIRQRAMETYQDPDSVPVLPAQYLRPASETMGSPRLASNSPLTQNLKPISRRHIQYDYRQPPDSSTYRQLHAETIQDSSSDVTLPALRARRPVRTIGSSTFSPQTEPQRFDRPEDIVASSPVPIVNGALPRSHETVITNSGVRDSSNQNGEPFELGISTLDTEPEFSMQWIRSKVHIFKGISDEREFIRIWADRSPWPPQQVVCSISETEMVPLYAYRSTNELQHVVFLRTGGVQDGVQYRFTQRDGNDKSSIQEMMAFQSALLGASLELEYPIADVLLRQSGSHEQLLRSARMQLWVEDHSWCMSARETAHSEASNTFLGRRRNRSIPLQDTYDDFEGAKIFLFAGGSIFVILITDRIICQEIAPKTLRLAPNKLLKCVSVQIKKIEGRNATPAGIPLDQSGIKFRDMDRGSFSDYKSLDIKFQGRRNEVMEAFRQDFQEKVVEWGKRRSKPQLFREHERISRVATDSRIVQGSKQY